MSRIEWRHLTPCHALAAEDAEAEALLAELVDQGRTYLGTFAWCREIVECYVGDISIGPIVGVLLFRIVPAAANVDEWLWVIAGDIPPAYLVLDDAPTPADALRGYIDEMRRWVAAVNAGEPTDDVIPVESATGGRLLEPTRERALDLEERLRFLERELLE